MNSDKREAVIERIKSLKHMKKNGHEKALAKLALAWVLRTGVRLTSEEVEQIYGMDNALHTRLDNEWNRILDERGTQ
mgnify:FL=1